MIPYWQSRTELLIGAEKVELLQGKHVLVVGLGGVGGICAEMIARAGIGRMTICDADKIDLSNTNRQIPALHSTVGKLKTAVIAERLRDINPEIQLTLINDWVRDELTFKILDDNKFDYVVDCIDTLSPKVFLIKACKDRNIPIVSSLGAGGKRDPRMAAIGDISETSICNLAKYVRKKLHKMGISNGVTCVYSTERADQDRIIETEKAFPKKSIIGTISYMPALFGVLTASVVIRALGEVE